MRFWLFLLADAAGCALWAGSYLLLGRIFHRQLDVLIIWLGLFGRRAGVTVALLLGLYIAFKYFERKRFVRKLRVNRVTPQQALDLMESETPVTVVDLRNVADVERGGFKIAGALLLRADELKEKLGQLPDAHEIILYCS